MAVIGLIKSKTFSGYDGNDVTVEFWRPGPFLIDPIHKRGWLKWVPYADQATFIADPTAFYAPGIFTFSITPQNWPFVTGTDPMTKFWAFVKTFTDTVDPVNGGEINAGIDWSTATDSIYP